MEIKRGPKLTSLKAFIGCILLFGFIFVRIFLLDKKHDELKPLEMGQPLNNLERQVLDLQNNLDSVEEFMKVFRESWIYGLGETDENLEGETILEEDTSAFYQAWNEGDKVILPFYTAVERLQQSGHGGEKFLGQKGGQFLDSLEPHVEVILNHKFDNEVRLIFDEDTQTWQVFKKEG